MRPVHERVLERRHAPVLNRVPEPGDELVGCADAAGGEPVREIELHPPLADVVFDERLAPEIQDRNEVVQRTLGRPGVARRALGDQDGMDPRLVARHDRLRGRRGRVRPVPRFAGKCERQGRQSREQGCSQASSRRLSLRDHVAYTRATTVPYGMSTISLR